MSDGGVGEPSTGAIGVPTPTPSPAPARTRVPALAPTRILIIDGRSGSGKTTLAAHLERHLGATVVHLDDLYPGWGGLERGSAASHEWVVEPLARGETAEYRRWNWAEDRYDETVRIEPGGVVIVEGCGALSRANHALADVSIWLELAEDARHARALARDSDDSWWMLWREQENAFYAREGSAQLADLTWHGGQRG